jgi:hypothetical protein
VDLVTGEFGLGEFAGEDDGAAGGIDFGGMAGAFGGRDVEEAAEHLYDVGIGVVVVVEEDDVKEGLVGGVELIGELLFLFQDLEVAVHLFLW